MSVSVLRKVDLRLGEKAYRKGPAALHSAGSIDETRIIVPTARPSPPHQQLLQAPSLRAALMC